MVCFSSYVVNLFQKCNSVQTQQGQFFKRYSKDILKNFIFEVKPQN